MKTSQSKKQHRKDVSNIQYHKRARMGDPNLELRPSFKGQQMASLVVPQNSLVLTTTTSTGVISQLISVDPVNQTSNWTTRYAPLWEEYRVIKSIARTICFSSANPGQVLTWWDEKNATSPTAAIANLKVTNSFSAGSNMRAHVSKWTAHDVSDLVYTGTSSSFVPATFAVYTDNAVFGSSAISAQYITVQVINTIQFRGYK